MKAEDKQQQPTRMSTAHSRELGEELRRVRHRARMSSGSVAEALGWSLGKLSKLETGSRGTGSWDIATLLGRCGADKPSRDRVMALAVEQDTGNFLRMHGQLPDTLAALSVHERAAATITTYEPLAIPNLAQTEDYAHALTGDAAIARTRIGRQQQMGPSRPRTVFYIHEAALRLPVGSREVMRDQLLHLTLMCGWARTTLRIVPMTGRSHTVLRSPATLLTFDAPIRPLAYTEAEAATIFHDAPDAVAAYQHKMRHLDAVALDLEESRQLLARWANAYDHQAA